ncbi:MAG: AMP-binding protein [Rhizomicrobium sp.]
MARSPDAPARWPHALDRHGIKPGDRVATLAWNTHRHIEAWYGIAGIGAIYHTLNPRLFPDQIVYIANHAEDRVMFFDITFAPLVEQIAPNFPPSSCSSCLTDTANLPKANIRNLVAYEDFIAGAAENFAWRTSTSIRPAVFAIPPARPAIRKACCIPIAPMFCMR